MKRKTHFMKHTAHIFLSFVALVCIFLSVAGFTRQKRVAIIADGFTQFVVTAFETPQEVLKQAGIAFNEAEDEIRMTTATLRDRTVINVYRPVEIKVKIDGKRKTYRTAQPTIGEWMAVSNLSDKKYRVSPPASTKIKPDLKITLESRSPEEILAADKQQKEDEAARLAREAAQQKENQRLAERRAKVASGQYIEANGKLWHIVSHRVMEATAYLPSDGNGNGITATGIPAGQGIAAVDPDVIPLGTYLYVPNYGIALAADTGGAIIGNIIDLCFLSYDEAIEFGRRDVDVYIVKEE